MRRRFAPAGNDEVAAARGAAADEHRVPTFGEKALEAVDALFGDEDAAERKRVADLFVDHFVGQPEFGYLGAHHAAGLRVGVEDHDFVSGGGKIARHGQRGGAGADAGDALAVAALGRTRQQRCDLVLVVGGDALQPADRHRLRLAPGRAGTPARMADRTSAREFPGKTFDFQLIRYEPV